jgi:hypothetical protein
MAFRMKYISSTSWHLATVLLLFLTVTFSLLYLARFRDSTFSKVSRHPKKQWTTDHTPFLLQAAYVRFRFRALVHFLRTRTLTLLGPKRTSQLSGHFFCFYFFPFFTLFPFLLLLFSYSSGRRRLFDGKTDLGPALRKGGFGGKARHNQECKAARLMERNIRLKKNGAQARGDTMSTRLPATQAGEPPNPRMEGHLIRERRALYNCFGRRMEEWRTSRGR